MPHAYKAVAIGEADDVTQALSYALMLAFFRNDMGFGGNNGFTDFKDILGFDLHSDKTRVALLMITAFALAPPADVPTLRMSARALPLDFPEKCPPRFR